MRTRALLFAAAVAACILGASVPAMAAKQVVAFFPLQNLSDNTIARDVVRLGLSIGEKLQDRLDVRIVNPPAPEDMAARRNKARSAGLSS